MTQNILRKIMLGTVLLGTMGQQDLHAATVDALASGDYSNAIKNEALLAAAPAETSEEPQLPTASFSMADGTVRGSVGSESSSVDYRGERQWFSAELGLGYYNPDFGGGKFRPHVGLATMVADNFAVGVLGDFDAYRRDIVLNTIWQTPLDGFRMKLSGGYMWGRQEFDFGTERVFQDLGQVSWVGSGEWIAGDSASSVGLHSIGASAWMTRSYERSHDEFELSNGSLFGFSADTQVAFSDNLVTKGSLGFEELDFPYEDGTKDTNESFYTNIECSWEPVDALMVKAGWKNGASEDRFSAGLSTGPVALDTWYSLGHSGLEDERGASLKYTYDFGVSKSQSTRIALSDRLMPRRSGDNYGQFLAEVMSRPVQMPSTALTKTADVTKTSDVAASGFLLTASVSYKTDSYFIFILPNGVTNNVPQQSLTDFTTPMNLTGLEVYMQDDGQNQMIRVDNGTNLLPSGKYTVSVPAGYYTDADGNTNSAITLEYDYTRP